MPTSPLPPELSRFALEALLVDLMGQVAALKQVVNDQRAEIACLKGFKGPPAIKPIGMDKATEPADRSSGKTRSSRGKVRPRVAIEDRVLKADAPAGSRFKGYVTYLVQDLVLSVKAMRYRRERWVTPAGQIIVAPLPAGIRGPYGPGLRRFILMQYHQGQSTLPRLASLLQSVGLCISKREIQRLLTEKQTDFLHETRDVLRAGLETSSWISVDDTGARHQARNGFCTQIGNDRFTWFGTRSAKSRLNFLDLLRAGHPDYVLNQAAVGYWRSRGLAGPLIVSSRGWRNAVRRSAGLAGAFAPTWHCRAGKGRFSGHPGPSADRHRGGSVGSIPGPRLSARCRGAERRRGQFDIGRHALCWVHAERLVHKLDTFTDLPPICIERLSNTSAN